MRYASDVGAPVQVAFTYADNHAFAPDWMFGVTTIEPVGAAGPGLGAQYAATLRFGMWHLTLECEISEYRRDAVIGYTLRRRRPGKPTPAEADPPGATLGTLTLRFDPLGIGRSVLTCEADYRPPRGVLGRTCGRLIDAGAQAALRRSESQLRRAIEQFHGTDLVGRIA
jgi:hypothetical protein